MRENSESTCPFKTIVVLGYLGTTTLFLYELFNLEAGHDGLLTFNETVTGFPEGVWDWSAWAIISTAVLLEAVTNSALVNPAKEAGRLFGIKDEKARSLRQSLLPVANQAPEVAQPSSLTKCIVGAISPFVVINSAVAGLASIIPIQTLLGSTPLSESVMGSMALLTFVYQTLLTAADAVEAYHEMHRGSGSVYSKSWNVSSAQWVRSFIEGFVITNVYYCIVAAYIINDSFTETLKIPNAVMWSQISSYVATVVMFTPRHERLFMRYLQTKVNGRTVDLSEVIDSQREESWCEATAAQKINVIVQASFYALIVMGITVYFTEKHLTPSLLRNMYGLDVALSVLVGGASFGFIFYTDWLLMRNRLAVEYREENFSDDGADFEEEEEEEYGCLIPLLATTTNLGSQFTRGFVMLTFFSGELNEIFDPMDLVMLTLLVSLVVGTTNFAYYQPKLMERYSKIANYAHGFFTARRQEEDEKGAYAPIELEERLES